MIKQTKQNQNLLFLEKNIIVFCLIHKKFYTDPLSLPSSFQNTYYCDLYNKIIKYECGYLNNNFKGGEYWEK